MPNALNCYNKHNVRNRINDAIIANTNPVCISRVDELSAARWTRVLGQLPNRANDMLSLRGSQTPQILLGRLSKFDAIPRHSSLAGAEHLRTESWVHGDDWRSRPNRTSLRAVLRILRSGELPLCACHF